MGDRPAAGLNDSTVMVNERRLEGDGCFKACLGIHTELARNWDSNTRIASTTLYTRYDREVVNTDSAGNVLRRHGNPYLAKMMRGPEGCRESGNLGAGGDIALLEFCHISADE
jgi:hypothetical protein